MSAEELATYQYQLTQISEALETDPDNAEFIKLKADLEELISLYSNLISSHSSSSSSTSHPNEKTSANQKTTLSKSTEITNISSSSSKNRRSSSPSSTSSSSGKENGLTSKTIEIDGITCKVGDTVSAKWAADGKYYPASVEGISTSTIRVKFQGYQTFANLSLADIRPIRATTPSSSSSSSSSPGINSSSALTVGMDSTSRSTDQIDSSNSLKKHSPIQSHHHGNGNKKRKENPAAKRESEQLAKQSAWLSFTKGAEGHKKKSKIIAPMKKTSMFATPDDPNAKVGVVGSGRGMTEFQKRGKHLYERQLIAGEE